MERPVDWTPTFDSAHTIPYGTHVLQRELKDIFPDSKVTMIKENTYEYLEKIQYDYRVDNYILIHQENIFTDATWEKLLTYVNYGGTAFISLGTENQTFEKYLQVKFHSFEPPHSIHQSNVYLSVLNSGKEQSFKFQKGVGTNYFSSFNPQTSEVLGYITYNGKKEPNFIKVYHGSGYFLLHAEPFAFTNYYMLRGDNYQYVTDVFSYLPDQDILWDNHRINQRDSMDKNNDGGFFSALSFILKHQSLRWAFFILLSMGILFLIFNSKRRQKAIKILEPYPNYSLSFAQTLSELYKNNADHTAIVKYKINYFLEQIRTHYNISAKDTEKDFSELLSAKSGVDLNLCKKIALQIDIYRSKNYLDKEDFFKLQSLIHSFNQKSGHYGRTTGRK